MTMPLNISTEVWSELAKQLEGDLFLDLKTRTLYATDASVYREMPLAVVLAKTKRDIQLLIQFAVKHNVALIPRTAGTSLGGQVVGNGIVVDVSKYFNKIIELNVSEKYVIVEPGVIRDDLNRFLAPHKLWFGPETSTANRAMIGGMVGKLTKIAQGETITHAGRADVNTGLLADLAAELCAPADVCADIRAAKTARYAGERMDALGLGTPFHRNLAQRVVQTLRRTYPEPLDIQILVCDFDGHKIAHYP